MTTEQIKNELANANLKLAAAKAKYESITTRGEKYRDAVADWEFWSNKAAFLACSAPQVFGVAK